MAHFHNQLNVALSWSLNVRGNNRNWWVEGLQVEVGLLNWAQIE